MWGIVVTNGLVIATAMIGGGGLLFLLWSYWIQSVVIGFFARRRMLLLQRFSTEGFTMNDRAVDPTPGTARSAANFFLLHYGFFHVIYAVFLLAFTAGAADSGSIAMTDSDTGQVHQFAIGALGRWDPLWLAALGFGFLQTHWASHREHVEADLRGTPKIGTLMGLPYARIIPMHLTIIFGVVLGAGGAVLLFGTLKTIADVVMHKVEHRLLQGPDHHPRG